MQSGYIDAMELQTYFKQRGVAVTQAEVRQMIADADLVGRGIQVEGEQCVVCGVCGVFGVYFVQLS